MNRPRVYPRRNPAATDICGALLVFALCVVNIAVDSSLHGWAAVVPATVAVALSLGVALRRRLPERMLLLALAGCLAEILRDGALPAAALAVYAIICAVADRGARWAVRLALAGGLGVAVLAAVRDADAPGAAIKTTVALSVPIALAWALGYRTRCRRCYRTQLAERAAGLAQIRAARQRAAVAAQRIEICREMYDIAGHRVAGMVVQAEAAGRVLDSAPGKARQALTVIAGTGRESETELRRARGLLRGQD
ncbi:histidine kinase dimerization/phosphoacceptor domain-containing protein [Streptomyces litchfieldiae]|uniref:histidine kinase n=1 Tax=Streptomyces litchfieldiae TaxID=3075543 RepID=A0ABU2MT93_9ACTN|nr:histidine kinase dimerization/phosphoacceptor domain-containing protein [Streptomyces sp. DSM 44938]MDT0344294.1 histidine kinase dimerization/phosphoacceptor domain-containing protein [Streptomyces sp. DSM 44938]